MRVHRHGRLAKGRVQHHIRRFAAHTGQGFQRGAAAGDDTAVLLSAQATDVGVNKATRKLFPVANTPQAILDLGLDGLEGYIKTIGLYRSKAKHLMEACRMLVDLHGSKVPRTREALEALPGVGRKTANVVLNSAFGEATMAVDTHIFRMEIGRASCRERVCMLV